MRFNDEQHSATATLVIDGLSSARMGYHTATSGFYDLFTGIVEERAKRMQNPHIMSLRVQPDILAVHGARDHSLEVEVKAAGRSDTGNHAIEYDCLLNAIRLADARKILFVVDDGKGSLRGFWNFDIPEGLLHQLHIPETDAQGRDRTHDQALKLTVRAEQHVTTELRQYTWVKPTGDDASHDPYFLILGDGLAQLPLWDDLVMADLDAPVDIVQKSRLRWLKNQRDMAELTFFRETNAE